MKRDFLCPKNSFIIPNSRANFNGKLLKTSDMKYQLLKTMPKNQVINGFNMVFNNFVEFPVYTYRKEIACFL